MDTLTVSAAIVGDEKYNGIAMKFKTAYGGGVVKFKSLNDANVFFQSLTTLIENLSK